jgi:hypothetical protein
MLFIVFTFLQFFDKPNRAALREPPQAPRNAMRISRAKAARNSGRT